MKSLELQTFLTGLRLRLLVMALLGMVPLLAFAIFTALPGPQKAPQLAPSVMQILALAALGLFMALWASEKFILAPLRRLDPATEPAGADAAHLKEPAQSALTFAQPPHAIHRMADALPQIAWVMQADGQHTHFNPGWTAYSGLALDESLGHGWTRVLHPEDSVAVCRHREQASQREEVYERVHDLLSNRARNAK